jgi:RNA polymerase sigma factor (sigma-70 family)
MTVKEYNESVDLHADALFRFVLKNVRDRDKAQDIVQDTFEKVWKTVSDVKSTNAKSFLFTTAYRTMIDAIRKDKKFSQLEQHHEDNLEAYKTKDYELKEVLDNALNKLPEIQRTVVLLRDYEGYNYKEIGEITQLTEPQVKVYIYRARIALKEIIGEIGLVI